METLSWKEHWLLQMDGRGGYVCRPAQLRFLPRIGEQLFWPFGLAVMDDGELIVAGIRRPDKGPPWIEQAYVAFSRDEGATWSEYVEIPGCTGRPMMLAYLGGGKLTFTAGWGEQDHYRYFSSDYGRTWPERIPVSKAPDGFSFGTEGNVLVERNGRGMVTRLAETGQTFADGPWPRNPTRGYIHWSRDGGRTWENWLAPKEWKWEDVHNGTKYVRGVSEGALVRAANGWLVAALRSDMPAKYLDDPKANDNLEGTGISISKDHGQTWDLDRMIVLDEFAYLHGQDWVTSQCGHLYSILLKDGSILTGYGNYLAGGVLVHWKPD